MRRFAIAAALAPILFVAATAEAGTVYSGPTGALPTDASFAVDFQAPTATLTTLSFTVDGYLSLDGDNFYEDDFSLTLNGHSIYTATFNLGGGASTAQSVAIANPYGASAANPTANGTGIGWNGGQEVVTFSKVLPLQSGLNTLVFAYTSLPAPNHAGFQGLGDEGWGIEKVHVGAVPELPIWAMLGLGFAGLAYAGAAHGRRNRLARVLA
jgi:hypothetical protein